MTQQPPSAEATEIAGDLPLAEVLRDGLARHIDVLCEQRVSAERERVNIEWEERTGLHRFDRPFRAPAERPAPEVEVKKP